MTLPRRTGGARAASAAPAPRRSEAPLLGEALAAWRAAAPALGPADAARLFFAATRADLVRALTTVDSCDRPGVAERLSSQFGRAARPVAFASPVAHHVFHGRSAARAWLLDEAGCEWVVGGAPPPDPLLPFWPPSQAAAFDDAPDAGAGGAGMWARLCAEPPPAGLPAPPPPHHRAGAPAAAADPARFARVFMGWLAEQRGTAARRRAAGGGGGCGGASAHRLPISELLAPLGPASSQPPGVGGAPMEPLPREERAAATGTHALSGYASAEGVDDDDDEGTGCAGSGRRSARRACACPSACSVDGFPMVASYGVASPQRGPSVFGRRRAAAGGDASAKVTALLAPLAAVATSQPLLAPRRAPALEPPLLSWEEQQSGAAGQGSQAAEAGGAPTCAASSSTARAPAADAAMRRMATSLLYSQSLDAAQLNSMIAKHKQMNAHLRGIAASDALRMLRRLAASGLLPIRVVREAKRLVASQAAASPSLDNPDGPLCVSLRHLSTLGLVALARYVRGRYDRRAGHAREATWQRDARADADPDAACVGVPSDDSSVWPSKRLRVALRILAAKAAARRGGAASAADGEAAADEAVSRAAPEEAAGHGRAAAASCLSSCLDDDAWSIGDGDRVIECLLELSVAHRALLRRLGVPVNSGETDHSVDDVDVVARDRAAMEKGNAAANAARRFLAGIAARSAALLASKRALLSP